MSMHLRQRRGVRGQMVSSAATFIAHAFVTSTACYMSTMATGCAPLVLCSIIFMLVQAVCLSVI